MLQKDNNTDEREGQADSHSDNVRAGPGGSQSCHCHSPLCVNR